MLSRGGQHSHVAHSSRTGLTADSNCADTHLKQSVEGNSPCAYAAGACAVEQERHRGLPPCCCQHMSSLVLSPVTKSEASSLGRDVCEVLEDLDGAGCHAARLVREAVLAAQLLDRGADLAQVVPRQRWEQVVLDLVVQPACATAVEHGKMSCRLAWVPSINTARCERVCCCYGAGCTARSFPNDPGSTGCAVAMVVQQEMGLRDDLAGLQGHPPVNQSFQGPALMSRVETSCALMKSFGFVYTSIALWLCATNHVDPWRTSCFRCWVRTCRTHIVSWQEEYVNCSDSMLDRIGGRKFLEVGEGCRSLGKSAGRTWGQCLSVQNKVCVLL